MSRALVTVPSIAQLVERRTVEVKLSSLGRCSNPARRNNFFLFWGGGGAGRGEFCYRVPLHRFLT